MFRFLQQKLAGIKERIAEAMASGEEEGPDAGAEPPEASSRRRRIRESLLDEVLEELNLLLLQGDVAVPVAEEIQKHLREEILRGGVDASLEPVAAVEKAMRRALEKVLLPATLDLVAFVRAKEKPVILMFVGVNGTGKTTTIAKIARLLKKNGFSTVLAAGDTFRAGAIEQLTLHSERLETRIIKHEAGSDPAAVAYDAIEHARAKHKDVVLIDTAGRMQTNINLMEEMAKVKRVAHPHLIIYVGDALAGNDAVDQAVKFNEAVGIDGVILCKLDADARGGSALSIAHVVKRPILYVGVGQGYEDLVPFEPQWLVNRILGGTP